MVPPKIIIRLGTCNSIDNEVVDTRTQTTISPIIPAPIKGPTELPPFGEDARLMPTPLIILTL
jgi:hypothetical protein